MKKIGTGNNNDDDIDEDDDDEISEIIPISY